MNPFDLLDHPIIFLRPKLSSPYSWAGHIPFAYLAISLIRPRKLVELGTHSGNSYLAFCQAVSAADVGTKCFAVDTWEGDGHATQYGNGVYTALSSYHGPRYSEFSTLLRKTFDDALVDFVDAEIDLLHIDGLHTYEAVKHDFETWLPKLSDRAVVLMHDVSVKDRDFGVWRYFEELEERYRTFRFDHSNGLGIVCVGDLVPDAFASFLDAADAAPDEVRRFFEGVASTVIDPHTGVPGALGIEDRKRVAVTAKLFYRSSDDVFSESSCSVANVEGPDGCMRLSFDLPAHADLSFMRVDPADLPGVYGIRGIRLISSAEEVIDVADFPGRARRIAGELLPPEPPAFVRFVSLGSDPSIEFDLSSLVQETPQFRPALVEVDVVYGPVLTDEVSAYLADVVNGATLQTRAEARTLNHVINLLVEYADASPGSPGTVVKSAIDELANLSSSLNERQARMELEGVLASDALQEQIEDVRKCVDRVEIALHEVADEIPRLGGRISELESSLVSRVEAAGQVMEKMTVAAESQSAILTRMAEGQERGAALLEALHLRLDRRSPFYWIRRLLGGLR